MTSSGLSAAFMFSSLVCRFCPTGQGRWRRCSIDCFLTRQETSDVVRGKPTCRRLLRMGCFESKAPFRQCVNHFRSTPTHRHTVRPSACLRTFADLRRIRLGSQADTGFSCAAGGAFPSWLPNVQIDGTTGETWNLCFMRLTRQRSWCILGLAITAATSLWLVYSSANGLFT